MRKKQLEIFLEQIQGFSTPRASLEQYVTPAPIAAELLYFAYMQGDLRGNVYDLGCGTGTLAIGAKKLGAENVAGFDIDHEAIKVAMENASRLGVEAEFICLDVNSVSGEVDTVVMNPPFGAQKPGADRPFLLKALEVAKAVYSIHNTGSEEFIKTFIEPNIITHRYHIAFPIKRTFDFHRKDAKHISVDLYRMEKKKKD